MTDEKKEEEQDQEGTKTKKVDKKGTEGKGREVRERES